MQNYGFLSSSCSGQGLYILYLLLSTSFSFSVCYTKNSTPFCVFLSIVALPGSAKAGFPLTRQCFTGLKKKPGFLSLFIYLLLRVFSLKKYSRDSYVYESYKERFHKNYGQRVRQCIAVFPLFFRSQRECKLASWRIGFSCFHPTANPFKIGQCGQELCKIYLLYLSFHCLFRFPIPRTQIFIVNV